MRTLIDLEIDLENYLHELVKIDNKASHNLLSTEMNILIRKISRLHINQPEKII